MWKRTTIDAKSAQADTETKADFASGTPEQRDDRITIDVRRLRKLYGDGLAVDDVSFSLAKGQICGLVGPNGAGKTTTMRCLAGLITPTDGCLRVAGFDVSRGDLSPSLLELKRRLAYVPDDPPLFDDLSVSEHFDFIGRMYRVDRHRKKSDELMQRFGLWDKRSAAATSLSRGMRQKLAVCCAYLFDPQILLLDEPLTGLDPPGIRLLLETVRERAEAGATVIISSHLLAMIEKICSHLLVITDGRTRFFGRSENLKKQYPAATTLEEAYFAATEPHDQPPSARAEFLDGTVGETPITFAIGDYQSETTA